MRIPSTTILATALVAMLSSAAHSAVSFTFQRISDTQATMTATGLVGLSYPTGINEGTFKNLELRGVMEDLSLGGPADGSVAQVAGNFQFGGASLQGWTVLQGDMIPFPAIFFGDLDTPSGSSSQQVTGGTIQWRPVGTTGQVWAEYQAFDSQFSGLNGLVQVGTWEIVPEPSSAALLGLGGIALLRRRR